LERFGNSLVLLDKLAAGGMAEVYRAKQLGHGGFEKIVAVKRILPQYAESDDFKEMFLQEASLSAHLQHPNVVQTYSNGEVGGYLFLTMEYVDGKNLRQILSKVDRQKKRIPIEHALFVIAEAAKGLNYAHEYVDERSGQAMNIIHRDMSPQNVMLGYDGTVKIVDFGIAKMAAQAESTRAGVLKGKFGYMSPEQARGMQLDRRTDVFALGIILFELLTQRRLFASDDDMRTLRLVKECRIPRPSKYNPSIGPELDRIVLKALAKEKAERYSSAFEFYEDIQIFLQEKFPRFMASDFSKFMKATFIEEIREEKLKREKLHREAPALLDNSRYNARVDEEAARPNREKDAANATVVDDDLPTQVSNAMGPVDGLQVPDVGADTMSKSGHSFSVAFEDPRPPRITELQLDSSKIDEQRTQIESFAPSSDLPPSQDFTLPEIPSNSGPSSLYVEVTPTYTSVTPAPKPSNQSAKIRRLAYVAIILIGVIFFLSEENVPVNDIKQDSQGTVPQVAVVEPVETQAREPERAPSAQEVREEEVAELEPIVSAPQPTVTREPSIIAADPVPSPGFDSLAEVQQQSPSGQLPGYLSVTSYPRADRILINGQVHRGPASERSVGANSRLELPPGEYEITLENTTYGVSWRGTVIIRSQRISPLDDVVLK
jgi:serine/threonine protein kinase